MAQIRTKNIKNPKVVAMCQGGNVRSVCIAYVLKYGFNIDALACSWEKNTPTTLQMLFDWADAIIVAEPSHLRFIPHTVTREKAIVVDIGPDRWGTPFHPELLEIVQTELLKVIKQCP